MIILGIVHICVLFKFLPTEISHFAALSRIFDSVILVMFAKCFFGFDLKQEFSDQPALESFTHTALVGIFEN